MQRLLWNKYSQGFRSEHFNHFDQNVWYPQSADILVLYIKNNFLCFHCGTIMLHSVSKLTFWCNVSIILSDWSNCLCSRKLTPFVEGREIRNIDVNKKNFELGKYFLKNVEIFQHVWALRYLKKTEENSRILKKTVWLVLETQIRNEYIEQGTIRSVLWSVPFRCNISTVWSIIISA